MSLFLLAVINYRDGDGGIIFFGANDTFIFIFSIANDLKIWFRKIEKALSVQEQAISLKPKNTVNKDFNRVCLNIWQKIVKEIYGTRRVLLYIKAP